MPELNQHEVARLNLGKHLVPESFHLKRAAAASAACAVEDVNLRRVEIRDERVAPPAPAVSVIVSGRIAYGKERRQLGIRRRRLSSPGRRLRLSVACAEK